MLSVLSGCQTFLSVSADDHFPAASKVAVSWTLFRTKKGGDYQGRPSGRLPQHSILADFTGLCSFQPTCGYVGADPFSACTHSATDFTPFGLRRLAAAFRGRVAMLSLPHAPSGCRRKNSSNRGAIFFVGVFHHVMSRVAQPMDLGPRKELQKAVEEPGVKHQSRIPQIKQIGCPANWAKPSSIFTSVCSSGATASAGCRARTAARPRDEARSRRGPDRPALTAGVIRSCLQTVFRSAARANRFSPCTANGPKPGAATRIGHGQCGMRNAAVFISTNRANRSAPPRPPPCRLPRPNRAPPA